MIATGILNEVRPGSSSTTGPAGYDPYQGDGTDAHLPEPNVSIDVTDGAGEPVIFDQPRKPVAGLRGIIWTLTRNGIPLLPLGPTKVARMGPGYNPSGRTPQPVNKVQQYVPVPGPAGAGEWYDYLR